ncbi:hypothetical protein DSCA_06330 [Desulfosarcina alkanivorans]|jgi:Fe-S-cluster containining protein|uniref:Zinc/iron-chelating domain-containing protein n=1 Tax=Desulfosarcina alkanivorans TaxID=571177 RepID=A0A5K7YDI6_9BACT|nr:YkgJ family cysteine cluster protein [Desulfosarcina alkanivorans]BBO66703.1 hypothetical protein DSCA_06330 [Desulfosarcina alkanivorans]
MPEKESLFLTLDDALDALCNALLQYPFQLNLISALWPMIFGDGTYVMPGAGSRSVWAKIPGSRKLILCRDDEMTQRIVGRLKRLPPEPERLARLCALVFGARVCADVGTDPDRPPGLRVVTDMAGFVCLQCGHCCRTLSFHDGCTRSDYYRWLELGRTDILDWVGTVRRHGHVAACRIWIVPGTNRYARKCPWLKKLPVRDQYACTIHEVRPAICRQYPGSRKHARMTGCRGV